MTTGSVVDTVALIHEVAKDLGCKPTAPVSEIATAVSQLEYSPERKRMNSDSSAPAIEAFDHVRFWDGLDAVRESRGIENHNKLAQAIGVNHNSLARLRDGKGVEFDSLLKILAWSLLDLRKYINAVHIV